MEFPVYLQVGAWQLHPHRVFEALAYTIALRLILINKRRDPLPFAQRSSVLVGGLAGGLVGAKALVMLQHLNLLWGEWLASLCVALDAGQDGGRGVVGGTGRG